MVYFEAPYITIHWNEENKYVRMEWTKWVQGENFRDALNKGLDLLKEKKSCKWLADLRELGVVTEEDQNWSNTDWFPRALQGGINCMALVVPKKTIAKMSVNNIMAKIEGTDLVTHYFDEVEEAVNWLKNQ